MVGQWERYRKYGCTASFTILSATHLIDTSQSWNLLVKEERWQVPTGTEYAAYPSYANLQISR
jgi:hypothetical protein